MIYHCAQGTHHLDANTHNWRCIETLTPLLPSVTLLGRNVQRPALAPQVSQHRMTWLGSTAAAVLLSQRESPEERRGGRSRRLHPHKAKSFARLSNPAVFLSAQASNDRPSAPHLLRFFLWVSRIADQMAVLVETACRIQSLGETHAVLLDVYVQNCGDALQSNSLKSTLKL